MELRLNIGLNEIISLIRQLPIHKKVILKNELEKEITVIGLADADLTTMLLTGPVMSKSEYEDFKSTQKHIGEWTKNVFA
jgi:hypothetical protein